MRCSTNSKQGSCLRSWVKTECAQRGLLFCSSRYVTLQKCMLLFVDAICGYSGAFLLCSYACPTSYLVDCTMQHPLRNESGGDGSASQHMKSCVLCTEIQNQRHRIRRGEGVLFALGRATKPNSSISKPSYPAGMVVVLDNKICNGKEQFVCRHV